MEKTDNLQSQTIMNRFTTHPAPQRGFTRLELLIVLGTLALLAGITFPVLANTKPRSERLTCVNNLRQVGRGFNMWAAEHGNLNPWYVDYTEGGMRGPGYNISGIGSFPPSVINNAWFHFLWVRNELGSPKVLACPSDAGKKVATDFTSSPEGLANTSCQNKAVSYFIGLHAAYDVPRSMLSGDRNIAWSVAVAGCSAGVNTARGIISISPPNPAWNPGLHNDTGNILVNDGSVEQFSSPELQKFLQYRAADDNGVHHLLVP